MVFGNYYELDTVLQYVGSNYDGIFNFDVSDSWAIF